MTISERERNRQFDAMVEAVRNGLEIANLHTINEKRPYTYTLHADLIVMDRNDKVWSIRITEP